MALFGLVAGRDDDTSGAYQCYDFNFGVPDGHFLTQACTSLVALSRIDYAFKVTLPYFMFSIRSVVEHAKLKPDGDTSALDFSLRNTT